MKGVLLGEWGVGGTEGEGVRTYERRSGIEARGENWGGGFKHYMKSSEMSTEHRDRLSNRSSARFEERECVSDGRMPGATTLQLLWVGAREKVEIDLRLRQDCDQG